MLARYKELNVSRNQAIENTIQVLGVSQEALLEIMKDYQKEQKKREAVQNEGVSIGE